MSYIPTNPFEKEPEEKETQFKIGDRFVFREDAATNTGTIIDIIFMSFKTCEVLEYRVQFYNCIYCYSQEYFEKCAELLK